MQLVEQHIIKDKSYMEICRLSKRLYNYSLYCWRQSYFGYIQPFSEYELTGLFAEFKHFDYCNLPAQTSQQIIKLMFKNVKSFFELKAEYKKNPDKFTGEPKPPTFKKETFITIFTNQQIRLMDGYILFPKSTGLEPIKTKVDNVCQVFIVPKSNHCVIDIIYDFEEPKQKEYDGKWMGADFGLNNVAACSTQEGSFLMNGKPLKSMNHYFNKRIQYLQSLLKPKQYSSKRIRAITEKRNRKVDDFLHKVSRIIVNKAIKEGVTKIILGNNKNWKHEINLGKKTNRQFVSIPHSDLIQKITYKAQMEGIEVIVTQEAYTSKCSALDLEEICKHETYLGKRKKRGLFVTSEGKLLNADVNGSINIARLGLSASGNSITKEELVLSAALAPKKINIL